MIVLPEGAFTVLRDKVETKTKSGIILTEDIQKKPNTGEICFTHSELQEFQGCKVTFRESFAEEIMIDNIKHLYFRDFNSSIYYVIV